jgi:RHS repeat-associated protein
MLIDKSKQGVTGLLDSDGHEGLDELLLTAYQMSERMYDPRVGRFMSEDPIRQKSGDNNLYRYVGNDPINTVDPSGHWRWGKKRVKSLWKRAIRPVEFPRI